MSDTFTNECLLLPIFKLVKAYTIHKIEEKYRKKITEEFILDMISKVLSLINKDTKEIVKNQEYVEDLFSRS